MEIRNWQQKIIDDFPSIVKDNRRFILKAPTGAGKTYLASELIKRFYNRKKVIVLCHRLVLLEQLEKALQKEHKIRKLAVSETSIALTVMIFYYQQICVQKKLLLKLYRWQIW